MRKLLLNAVVLMGALSLWGGGAGAMPLGRAQYAPDASPADWQCGRGWHVTSWGDCRPNRRLDYRFSSWPYRYDVYPADGWSDGRDWRHYHHWHDDDAPRAYDWSWGD